MLCLQIHAAALADLKLKRRLFTSSLSSSLRTVESSIFSGLKVVLSIVLLRTCSVPTGSVVMQTQPGSNDRQAAFVY